MAREEAAAAAGADVEVLDTGTLATLNRAEIDIQIATAKRYPRSIARFKATALEMATLDEETAESMFYALPRREKGGGTKIIEGPSVRLAEIVASAWGNLRAGSRVIETGDRFVTAQGACFDLEKNVAIQAETRRRITGSDGRRYSDDMINVTANAAASISFRQAVFKVVPFAYVKPVYEAAKLVALGKGLSMEQRRTRAFEWYTKLGAGKGVQPDRVRELVLALLERKGVDDITQDDLVTLTGIKTALMDGETTFEQVFADLATPVAAPPKGGKLDALTEKLTQEAEAKVAASSPAQEPGAAEGAAVLTDTVITPIPTPGMATPGTVLTWNTQPGQLPAFCPVCQAPTEQDVIQGQKVVFCSKDSSHIPPSAAAAPADEKKPDPVAEAVKSDANALISDPAAFLQPPPAIEPPKGTKKR